MDDVDDTYTMGVPEDELEQLVDGRGHGALADGNDAYAIPLNYHYDGSRCVIRMGDEPGSAKIEYAETTDIATLIVYEFDEATTSSWSVVIRGAIDRLPQEEQDEYTDAQFNELFPPFRRFDEDRSRRRDDTVRTRADRNHGPTDDRNHWPTDDRTSGLAVDRSRYRADRSGIVRSVVTGASEQKGG